MFSQVIPSRNLKRKNYGVKRLPNWRKISIIPVIVILNFGTYSGAVADESFEVRVSNPGLIFPEGKPTPQPEEGPDLWVYYTQSGDTLETIAARFHVLPQEIKIPEPNNAGQLLDPGIRLLIPRPEGSSSSFAQIMSDSDVVYSPSAIGFNIHEYVSKAGGYLSTHQEYMRSTGWTNGAEIVERIAIENSFHPQLLLAILEYQCGCVLGPLAEGVDPNYLLGISDPARNGLFRQLGWVVDQLSLGYYGWQEGLLTELAFDDGPPVSLTPDSNKGSVAIAYLFSRLNDRYEWIRDVDPENGFKALYENMYAGEGIEDHITGPLFPHGLTQPDLILPFQQDRDWGFTSGPHKAWETDGALAALDFAPASERSGCQRSDAWIVAVADGFVVRSEHGAVVLDLDGDGFENTGWVVLYMHVEDRQRTPEGTYLRRGEPIGHPSCEGGPADGTHVHIARKYNGEWIAADGPMPFVMSGWVAQAGYRPFEGSLSRGDQVVVANPLSPAQAFISLAADDIILDAKISRDLCGEE
jgi:murein DD-endopeptidase MepM/ murein hydrolase activator NlpD